MANFLDSLYLDQKGLDNSSTGILGNHGRKVFGGAGNGGITIGPDSWMIPAAVAGGALGLNAMGTGAAGSGVTSTGSAGAGTAGATGVTSTGAEAGLTGILSGISPGSITGILSGMNSGTDYGTALANQSGQSTTEQDLRQQALLEALQKIQQGQQEDALKPLTRAK